MRLHAQAVQLGAQLPSSMSKVFVWVYIKPVYLISNKEKVLILGAIRYIYGTHIYTEEI
jgi:hypothetical protein